MGTNNELAKGMEKFCNQEAQKKKLPPIKETLEKEELPRIENATLENVYKTTEKWIGIKIKDRNRIDAILATALSNKLSGSPIWLFVVGNSGDWKSVFVRALEGLSNVIVIDQITKNTLASGRENVDDLGDELQHSNKILLFPDIASLTSKNNDEKNEIWGQFRNLYDGFINKKTGSGVKKKYDGCHVTIIACSTEVIRTEILMYAQLGTRELIYDTNTDPLDNSFKMDKAWENEKYEDEMHTELQKIICDFLTYKKIKNIEPSEDIKDFLKRQAIKLSILRATGKTDRRYRELINPIYPEVPTRLIKQLKRMYICLKSLDENYPDERAKEIISHIVNSSGDKVRMMILEVVKNHKGKLKINDIQQKTKLGRSAVKSQCEMLWNLGILNKDIIEERIGGYVKTDYDGRESIAGGRFEEIAYYEYIENKQTSFD